jgi:hypothetical protein
VNKLDLWGLEASPYLLKMEALLNCAELPFRRLPRDGGRWENMSMALRLSRARRQRTVQRYPTMDSLDEYPEVPYLIISGSDFQYDSTAVAHWLDDQVAGASPYFPEDRLLNFVATLIDEAFDEYGLYMVHHQRWVCSAQDTNMPEVTSKEYERLMPPLLSSRIRTTVPRRQVRRCPYLFSVAPEGYQANVEPRRVPPSRPGFPATHALLEESWQGYLAAIEGLLQAQPYLLGDRFTIADASAYGQLSMNLIDPTSVAELQRRAPATHRWLLQIQGGKMQSSGELNLTTALQPLLDIIMNTFAPLMVQNENAYRRAVSSGQTLFNEAAFDRDLALYDGNLLGNPFRSVVKTFQVRVWQDLCQSWRQLGNDEKATLRKMLPNAELFESSQA